MNRLDSTSPRFALRFPGLLFPSLALVLRLLPPSPLRFPLILPLSFSNYFHTFSAHIRV